MTVKNKKILIILVIVAFVALIITGIFLVKKAKDEDIKYPESIYEVNNIDTTEQELTVDKDVELSEGDYKYYKVSPIDTSIQTFMSKIGVDLIKEETGNDYVNKWADGESFVSFDSTNNYLQFNFETPIDASYDLTNSVGIERWMEASFNLVQSYEIGEITEEGDFKYVYANIILDDIEMEFKGRDDRSTLFLILDSWGYIKGGSIILVNIEEQAYVLPVIDVKYLSSVINKDIYPKEIVPDLNGIYETLNLSYLSDEWSEIEDSLSNCEIVNGGIIYLYSDSSQSYLLPVYKLESFCEVTYKDEIYSVPAVVYTNAVSPEYISSE